MLICPKCGANLEESDAESPLSGIASGFFEAMGGPIEIGRNLADGLKLTKPGSQQWAQAHSTSRAYLAEAEKREAHQQHIELLEAEQERAMVLEYLMANKDVLITALELGRKRGLLRDEAGVIEGEFVKA